MNKFAIALGVFAVAVSAGAVAREGRDMQGNKVIMPEHFSFGGDPTGAYAGGRIGTGAKDPAVCGTFDPKSTNCPGRPRC